MSILIFELTLVHTLNITYQASGIGEHTSRTSYSTTLFIPMKI